MAVTFTLPEEISAKLAKRVACQRVPPDDGLLQLLSEDTDEETICLVSALADTIDFLESLIPPSVDELDRWERDWQTFEADLKKEADKAGLFSEAISQSNGASWPRPNCP
jgi:hypothetical protein